MVNTNFKRILFDECLANGLRLDVCERLSFSAKGAPAIAERLASGIPLMKWQRAALRKPSVLVALLAADFDVSTIVSRESRNRALDYAVENGLFSLIPKAIAAGAAPDDILVSFFDRMLDRNLVNVPIIYKAACMRNFRALELLLEAGVARDNHEILQTALNMASEAGLGISTTLLRVALSACEVREGIRSRSEQSLPNGPPRSRFQDIL